MSARDDRLVLEEEILEISLMDLYLAGGIDKALVCVGEER